MEYVEIVSTERDLESIGRWGHWVSVTQARHFTIYCAEIEGYTTEDIDWLRCERHVVAFEFIYE